VVGDGTRVADQGGSQLRLLGSTVDRLQPFAFCRDGVKAAVSLMALRARRGSCKQRLCSNASADISDCERKAVALRSPMRIFDRRFLPAKVERAVPDF
jgi:hypothetical protein